MLPLALAVITLVARAVDPSPCSLVGLWHEPTMAFTTRITESRFRSWSGGPGVDERTPPAAQGWVDLAEGKATFGDEGHPEPRYPYSVAFDSCDTVTLSLQPSGQVLHMTRVKTQARAN